MQRKRFLMFTGSQCYKLISGKSTNTFLRIYNSFEIGNVFVNFDTGIILFIALLIYLLPWIKVILPKRKKKAQKGKELEDRYYVQQVNKSEPSAPAPEQESFIFTYVPKTY
jgi:hypothetical protein